MMENFIVDFKTQTALQRIYEVLINAQNLGAETFNAGAVIKLIYDYREIEKNLIISAFMAGRDFQGEEENVNIPFHESGIDYYNETHY